MLLKLKEKCANIHINNQNHILLLFFFFSKISILIFWHASRNMPTTESRKQIKQFVT